MTHSETPLLRLSLDCRHFLHVHARTPSLSRSMRSRLPCPYWCAGSAGFPEMLTANRVTMLRVSVIAFSRARAVKYAASTTNIPYSRVGGGSGAKCVPRRSGRGVGNVRLGRAKRRGCCLIRHPRAPAASWWWTQRREQASRACLVLAQEMGGVGGCLGGGAWRFVPSGLRRTSFSLDFPQPEVDDGWDGRLARPVRVWRRKLERPKDGLSTRGKLFEEEKGRT